MFSRTLSRQNCCWRTSRQPKGREVASFYASYAGQARAFDFSLLEKAGRSEHLPRRCCGGLSSQTRFLVCSRSCGFLLSGAGAVAAKYLEIRTHLLALHEFLPRVSRQCPACQQHDWDWSHRLLHLSSWPLLGRFHSMYPPLSPFPEFHSEL